MLSTLALYRAGYDFKRLFTLSDFYDRDRTAFYQAIQSVLARENRLNLRQALALERLLEKGELRIEDLEELCPGVHRRTLQRDLEGLVERRHLFSDHFTGGLA